MQLDVFTTNNPELPLAQRLRPKDLNHFVGQPKLRGEINKILASPRHVIFWGPPGTGKTTLACLLARLIGRELKEFSAVTSGLPELKKLMTEMIENNRILGKKSILFIDEIHRFNKSQQDALLPYLENGDFLFFGATTEYPQTALNRALISRVSLIELEPLSEQDLLHILNHALEEVKRPDLISLMPHLAQFSNGDARFALNQLARLLVYGAEELKNSELVLSQLFENTRHYDRNANRHYDVISAFIKSIRGSDPQAALLYLAIMLEGGEDPEFIARRLMILASEDIGLANSQALQVSSNAHYVVKQIGMPEARITLSHATIFLALSPKSNSAYLGINQAIDFVQQNPTINVPGPISQTSPEKKNYLYPHDFPNHWIRQDYLPKGLKTDFYQAGSLGSEKGLWEQYLKTTGKNS